ncbi:hypothetical protein EAO70_04865 [Streptomyces sp. adm13(2018)]|uniref:hypothetical protein n=1 Tax=Streptomyces sp. adm13(2018) TaxID=2479007 RepID=UPI0011CD6952|nr:hypothetical protein [Streptomyces sp. adm13(2018)]TXS23106.1 hypothetical protein EAO70_04865 [Streptomyces sp. adm13(2018)]
MTQPEPASRHTVDEELQHLRIAAAGADLALDAACRKTDEQRTRAERAEAKLDAVRAECDALEAELYPVADDGMAIAVRRIRAVLDPAAD